MDACPGLPVLLGQTILITNLGYTTWACIPNDHNIFCTLRRGRTTAGSNASSAFLVLICSTKNQSWTQKLALSKCAAIYRQSFAACLTLNFLGNLQANRKTRSLLPTSSAMLPATRNHFDRAEQQFWEETVSKC